MLDNPQQHTGFPGMGVPYNGWLLMENLIQMDDFLGYLHFRKPPYRHEVPESTALALCGSKTWSLEGVMCWVPI